MINPNEKEFSKYLLPVNDPLSRLTIELRDFLKEFTHPEFELIANSTQSLNIGFGYTTKAWDCFIAIIIYKNHINLSFPSGADLKDHGKILQGTGKRVRHIRISSFDAMNNKQIRTLILEAKKIALNKLHND